jgi:hypothetical protein
MKSAKKAFRNENKAVKKAFQGENNAMKKGLFVVKINQ